MSGSAPSPACYWKSLIKFSLSSTPEVLGGGIAL